MPTSRCGAMAVNTEDPEYLIIAGGRLGPELLNTVEVLIAEQWSSLQPLPIPCLFKKGTIHNGILYLTGWGCRYYCCNTQSLCSAGCTVDEAKEPKLWKTMCFPFSDPTLVSFGRQLVAINRGDPKIHAYSPLSQSWVHVENFPQSHSLVLGRRLELTTAISIPNGELIIIWDYSVVKGTLRASLYDVDSQFSMSALSRLEAAEIPILTSLAKICEKLAAAIGLSPSTKKSAEDSCADSLLKEWIARNTLLPPTWRSLYDVLRKLDLEELLEQIEEYFNCPRSLMEQCTAVIISALLEQKSLEPDQLHVRLPDYVPPRVKRCITHIFKAHTHQLPPPTPSPPPSKKLRSYTVSVEPETW